MSQMKLAVFAAVVFALPVSLSCGAEPTKDSLETVRKNVEQGKAVLVDVRSQSEWKRGHIENAIFLPVDALEDGLTKEQLKAKLPGKKIVYTYCVVGARARTAGGILEEAGYHARPLKAGYEDLLEAGFKNSKK